MSKQRQANGGQKTPHDMRQAEPRAEEEQCRKTGESRSETPEESVTEQAEAAAPADQQAETVTVEKLQEEIQRQQDEIMRLNAEMDNLRKRNARELENLRKYALDKFTKELLPVVDSMEKAMQVDRETTTVDQMLEGTALTQKILHKILRSHGLEVIDPQGEKFDPEQHEAVSAVPAEGSEPNTVLDVFQKGYKLNGRVVRPAMVVVAK